MTAIIREPLSTMSIDKQNKQSRNELRVNEREKGNGKKREREWSEGKEEKLTGLMWQENSSSA